MSWFTRGHGAAPCLLGWATSEVRQPVLMMVLHASMLPGIRESMAWTPLSKQPRSLPACLHASRASRAQVLLPLTLVLDISLAWRMERMARPLTDHARHQLQQVMRTLRTLLKGWGRGRRRSAGCPMLERQMMCQQSEGTDFARRPDAESRMGGSFLKRRRGGGGSAVE